jgi:polar amino acid transport system substrate-binding protein
VVRTAETIDCKVDFVSTARGAPLLRSLVDLRGKRVGITHGYPYSREVMAASGHTLEEAASDELNIRKLVAGRIDAFVLDEKTGIQAAKALGLSDAIQHDSLAPVSRQDVYVAFQPNDRGRELAGRMSEALRQLKASGRYQAITQGITFARGCSGR